MDRARRRPALRHPADPAARLWHGAGPSLVELSDALGLEVRPLAELRRPGCRDSPPAGPARRRVARRAAGAVHGEVLHAVRQDRLPAFADVRGIRIEDDVLVTATGHEVLSAALPSGVAELEALRS